MSVEGFIAPDGTIYPAPFFQHAGIAYQILHKNKWEISTEAREAAKHSAWPPSVIELLRRNWVRQYHCEFTVWKLNRITASAPAKKIAIQFLWKSVT